jgi:hypothetical protein
MKGRIIKGLVVLALLAFIYWLQSHMSFTETKVSMPLTGEAARNPFYAAIKLSDELGAHAAWERVFTAPPQDSVIMLSTWNWTLSRLRRERIERWVEAGGRLVVDESLIGGMKEFERWSGIGELRAMKAEHEDEEEEEEEEGMSDSERALVERFMPEKCDTLIEDVSKRSLSVCGVDNSRSLMSSRKTLWALREGQKIHALRTAVGRGSVTVINATPFRHRDIFEGDHPLLLVTVTQLHRGDSLMFLTEEDHASLLTLVWRFGAPVVLIALALIVLALWRVTSRFGPLSAPAEAARRSLAEQIRGTGQFAQRFGAGSALHAATMRALRDAAIQRFPAYDRMSSGERVAALCKAASLSADDLGPALNFSGTRNSHELRNAIAIIETARRKILMRNRRSKHGN